MLVKSDIGNIKKKLNTFVKIHFIGSDIANISKNFKILLKNDRESI